MDTGIFWIEYTARHGKKALRSPLVDMPWWQENLIDVYGSILIAIVGALYGIRFAVKRIIRIFSSSSGKHSKKKLKKDQ